VAYLKTRKLKMGSNSEVYIVVTIHHDG